MEQDSLNHYVKRYTTLTSALDILRHRRLTLLNPRTWDDTNDAYFMELYREYTGAGSVLALCCTMAPERYHHWHVFANGIEGICLELKREPLERSLPAHGAFSGPVDYETLQSVERLPTSEALSLAFLKRQGYSDEREWRIIAQQVDPHMVACHVPLDLAWVHRIVLNPWMPQTLKDTIREVIRSLPGCEKLSVISSTLTNNKRWKSAGDRLVGRAPAELKKRSRRRSP